MDQSLSTDIKFVVAIILEAVVLVWGLVGGVSLLGYILLILIEVLSGIKSLVTLVDKLL